MKAIEGLRAAGAEIIFDDSILPDSFADVAARIYTAPYVREGTETFLKNFGPALYHSAEEYEKVAGKPLPSVVTGRMEVDGQTRKPIEQHSMSDGSAQANFYDPLKRALDAYAEPFQRLHLDGLVYPAAQMPPPDETMPQNGRLSSGPHSDTAWVNMLGVPAIVVPGGFYDNGLPFGLEISALPWHDGDLLGYAFAYEQATHHRHPPVLVDKGLIDNHQLVPVPH
jgi:Asp-tRNA(Asn)/Glu-tRNA(Gln) amidotransferase A subunit family amidase